MKAKILIAVIYSSFEMLEKYTYLLLILSLIDGLGIVSLEDAQIIFLSFIAPFYILINRILHCLTYNFILKYGKCVTIKVVNVEEIFQIGKLNNPTIKITFIIEKEQWKEFYYYKTKIVWTGDKDCFFDVQNAYIKNHKIVIDENGMPSIYM